jgi:hypothetical protein
MVDLLTHFIELPDSVNGSSNYRVNNTNWKGVMRSEGHEILSGVLCGSLNGTEYRVTISCLGRGGKVYR